jgi:hypothetical protein
MPGQWGKHQKLQARLHQEYPDDLQVVVHDGGPRLSRVAPEVVWVRITSGEGDLFNGTVLNQPTDVSSVAAGSSVRFKVPESGEFPLMVTEKYLLERADWIIHPCNRCSLTELFDAPSDLLRVVFPGDSDQMQPEMFTAICGWCGGAQLVQRSGTETIEWPSRQTPKRWWKFWRRRTA